MNKEKDVAYYKWLWYDDFGYVHNKLMTEKEARDAGYYYRLDYTKTTFH